MDTLAKRLKFARKERKLTQQQLAAQSGVQQSDVSKIERGDTLKTTGLLALARALGCSPHWLDTGDGQWNAPALGVAEPAPTYHTDDLRPLTARGRVPLISFVQAGRWSEIADNFGLGEADDWVEPTESKPSSRAFALQVSGDSMTSPYVGSDVITFPEGTVIVVDPDQHADAGHFVVAKDVVTQKATFKKLMYDGGRWYLKALNPAYPTVEIEDPAVRVIGRVVEFQGKRGKL